jgi:hypothetical protein
MIEVSSSCASNCGVPQSKKPFAYELYAVIKLTLDAKPAKAFIWASRLLAASVRALTPIVFRPARSTVRGASLARIAVEKAWMAVVRIAFSASENAEASAR